MNRENIIVLARRPNIACPACRGALPEHAWEHRECPACGARYHAECDLGETTRPCGCPVERSWVFLARSAARRDLTAAGYPACEEIERRMLSALRDLPDDRWARRSIFRDHEIRETYRRSIGESVESYRGVAIVRDISYGAPRLADDDEVDAEIERRVLDTVEERLVAVARFLDDRDGRGDEGEDDDLAEALDRLDEALDDLDADVSDCWCDATFWAVDDADEALAALRTLGPDAARPIADYHDAPEGALRRVARVLQAATTLVRGVPVYSRGQRAVLRRAADEIAEEAGAGPLVRALREEAS